MLPPVTPQLLGNSGLRALQLAIADPGRYAMEGNVDGVRRLVTFEPGGVLGTRNRRGERRQWLRAAARGLPPPAGQPAADPVARHCPRRRARGRTLRRHNVGAHGIEAPRRGAAIHRVRRAGPRRDGFRPLPWQQRRERLELLAQAFEVPVYLSHLVEPSAEVAQRMLAGDPEGLVLKDRSSPFQDGSRADWWKVKDRSSYERVAWCFDRR